MRIDRLSVACLIAASLALPTLLAKEQSAKQSGGARKQKSSPTTLAIAEMTPAQRVHAELYKDFAGDTKVLDAGIVIERLVHSASSPIAGRTTDKAVGEMACTVDTVFVGQVIGQTVMPTLDGTFLFTDYQVDVTDVIREPKAGSTPARAVVTRPGGFVERDGVKVGVTVNTWPLLKVGATYLFFGQLVPQTRAYRTPNAVLFEVAGGSMKSTTPVKGVVDSDWYSGVAPASLRATIASAKCTEGR